MTEIIDLISDNDDDDTSVRVTSKETSADESKQTLQCIEGQKAAVSEKNPLPAANLNKNKESLAPQVDLTSGEQLSIPESLPDEPETRGAHLMPRPQRVPSTLRAQCFSTTSRAVQRSPTKIETIVILESNAATACGTKKTVTKPQPARPASTKPSVDDDDEVTFISFTPVPLPSIDPEVEIVCTKLQTKRKEDGECVVEQKDGKEVSVVGQKRGIRPLVDYPHLRSLCEVHPFADGSNAIERCKMCCCFVCDDLADSCTNWDIHAVANERSAIWIAERNRRRRARHKQPLEIGRVHQPPRKRRKPPFQQN